MTISIILASQSKPRRDVLYAAGICPTIKVSHVDEPAALEQAASKLSVPGLMSATVSLSSPVQRRMRSTKRTERLLARQRRQEASA